MTNWISDLNDTVAQLKQSENRMQDGFHTLTNNVTSLTVSGTYLNGHRVIFLVTKLSRNVLLFSPELTISLMK